MQNSRWTPALWVIIIRIALATNEQFLSTTQNFHRDFISAFPRQHCKSYVSVISGSVCASDRVQFIHKVWKSSSVSLEQWKSSGLVQGCVCRRWSKCCKCLILMVLFCHLKCIRLQRNINVRSSSVNRTCSFQLFWERPVCHSYTYTLEPVS